MENIIEIRDLSLMADDINVDTFKPNGSFCLVFNVDIGVKGEKGSDEFRFTVCNKSWLLEYLLNDTDVQFLNDYNCIVIKKFSVEILKKILQDKINEINLSGLSTDWTKTALKINQYFRWEYIDEYLTKNENVSNRYM